MNANPLRGDRRALDHWRDNGRRRETSSIGRGFGIAFGICLFLVVLYVLYSLIVGVATASAQTNPVTMHQAWHATKRWGRGFVAPDVRARYIIRCHREGPARVRCSLDIHNAGASGPLCSDRRCTTDYVRDTTVVTARDGRLLLTSSHWR